MHGDNSFSEDVRTIQSDGSLKDMRPPPQSGFPQVYEVNFETDENMKEFNEFCVKCHGDSNTKNLATGHLAVLWHFATGKGTYKK